MFSLIDLQVPDKHGITPLLAAIYEGHTECVKLLLAKVNAVDILINFSFKGDCRNILPNARYFRV